MHGMNTNAEYRCAMFDFIIYMSLLEKRSHCHLLGHLNTPPILIFAVLWAVDIPFVFTCILRNTDKEIITVLWTASFEKEQNVVYKCYKKLNIQT